MRGYTEAEQRAATVAEAWRWLGTPYHPHGRLLSVGVDCGNLLAKVYENAGVIAPLDPGFYETGWHLHRSEELFIGWLRTAGAFPVLNREPRPGDTGIWRFGRTYSHGGIVVEGGLVVHAYLERGVIASGLSEEPLASRPVQFWTFWE